MSIVYNGKKASDLVVNGKHVREAWINGKKVWPEENEDEWFVLEFSAVSYVKIYIEQPQGRQCEVDWGDGTVEKIGNLINDETYIAHFYDQTQERIVKFRGKILSFHMADKNRNEYCRELINVLTIPSSFCPTSTYEMFCNCKNLKSVPIFNTSDVLYASYMFYSCEALEIVPSFDFSKLIGASNMFYYCISLLELPTLNFTNVKTLYSTFYGCTKLKEIKFTGPIIIDDGVTGLWSSFEACHDLEYIDGTLHHPRDKSYCSIGYVACAQDTFKNCYKLKNMPLGDVSLISNFDNCFENCRSLTTVDLIVENGRDFDYMFSGCTSLASVRINFYCDNILLTWDQVQYYGKYDLTGMFDNCPALLSKQLLMWNLQRDGTYERDQYWPD